MLFLAQLLCHAGLLDQSAATVPLVQRGPFVGAGRAACDQAKVAATGW